MKFPFYQNQEFIKDSDNVHSEINAFIAKYCTFIKGIDVQKIGNLWLFDFLFDKSISPNCNYDWNPIGSDHENTELSNEIQEFNLSMNRFANKWHKHIVGVQYTLIDSVHKVKFHYTEMLNETYKC